MMNEGAVLLSPTFPPPPGAMAGGGFGGFESRVRKGVMRKTVDYQSSTLRYLEASSGDIFLCICHRTGGRLSYSLQFFWWLTLAVSLHRAGFGSETSGTVLLYNQTLPTSMM